MNVDELNQAWNELRNRAFGRGTKPLVSPVLASELEGAIDAWRVFRGSIARITDPVALRGLNTWIQRYNALEGQVATQLGDRQPSPLPRATSLLDPSSLASSAAQATARAAMQPLALGAGAVLGAGVAVAVGLYLLAGRK